MTASYEQINYSLRPAKNIERKMIADSLRRLREFRPLHEYRYVGFGSTYFSDFSLFHKALGVREMTSIEKDADRSHRFDFNRPFACIEMEYGMSTDVLPTLSWANEAIVWLDYDGQLDSTALADVRFVGMQAKPGSVLIASVNARPGPVASDRVKTLRDAVGPENVPATVRSNADLGGWKLAAVSRQIATNVIEGLLRDRNATAAPGEEVRWQQLFNFHYQDGAKMLTVGGLFYRADQVDALTRCAFSDFPYVEVGVAPYRIEVPNLTFREMRHLNEQLPTGATAVAAPGVPDADVKRYSKVYRYFPAFVDAEI